ncbi:MAG TPA: uroporphyrinogen decarboxylase family protein [Spirochaetia bacterium]|nr:uroporphyrinogen decarboxylase family protein [Spirochaetia bacterium]
MSAAFTPKQRMLAAYRGQPCDRPPVAPEFWYYYPARLLGVDMIAFERDVPFWLALKRSFERWSCEGWGAAFADLRIGGMSLRRSETAIGEGRYRETTVQAFAGHRFESTKIYDKREPSAMERYPVTDPEDLSAYLAMALSPEFELDFSAAIRGHTAVGETYLLEYWLGVPFFDWIAEATGFEGAVVWVTSAPQREVEELRERYQTRIIEVLRLAAARTPFESFAVGCSSSCNSLLGPTLWRKLDKPFLTAVTREAHRLGKLLHMHFHGRSRQALEDFVQIGADCVCPFERPPGGDIEGAAGLRAARSALAEAVTFNGNVHTVETLIRGTPEDARREVREIKGAFQGSRRFIIGTGDQVGGETPDENIAALIEEGKAD